MGRTAALRTPENDRQDRRFDRYRLQRVIARRLLCGWGVERCAKPLFNIDHVWVKRSDKGAYYSGLSWCGSIWTCPVCAHRIAEGRRIEVKAVIEAHIAAGGAVYMATFTIPHHRFQTCVRLVDGVRTAWKRVQQGREWQAIKERAGNPGFVRALEPTHGDNGWHPHLHVLFFFDDDKPIVALPFGAALFDRWAERVKDMGFGECNPEVWRFERAETPEAAGDYVSKWGPDAEITKGHIKKGRHGGRGAFQIALDFADHGDPRDAAIFREYAEAFKGARQLTWSRGLKAKYAERIAENSDHANAEPEGDKIVRINWREWLHIVEQGWQTAVLEAVETFIGLELLLRLERIGVHRGAIFLPGLGAPRPQIRTLED